MNIKVCGIRTRSNLNYLDSAPVDFIGFIFFEGSKRYFADGELSIDELKNCTKSAVGVFVNASLEQVAETVNTYELAYAQLHGDESVQYCRELNEAGIKIIKAFPVQDRLPDQLAEFEPYVDYFLFDTKGKDYGGNGTQFDWEVLSCYSLQTPFFLSGGIGPEDAEVLKSLQHPMLYAVDVNSKFEKAPGQKNEQLLQQFLKELKQ